MNHCIPLPRPLRLLLVSVLGLFSAGLEASPLISIGDSVDIYFRGAVQSRYESNLFLNYTDKEDDFIFTFSPGFEINVGKKSEVTASLIFREDIDVYMDRSELNDFRHNVNGNISYDSGAITKITFYGGFTETASNSGSENVDGSLIRKHNYNLGFDSAFRLTDKSQLEFKVAWNGEDYRNFKDRFKDRDYFDVLANFYYKITERIELGPGYRYRYTDIDPIQGDIARDRSDHYLNLRIRGELTARLFLEQDIGYQVRHINGLDTDSSFALMTRLTYDATEKLKLTVGASRDFSTSGSGSSIENTGLDFQAKYGITDKLQFVFNSAFKVADYKTQDREDDLFTIGFLFNYVMNEYFRFNAGYTYTNNDSTSLGGSYQGHSVQVTSQVKY